MTHIRGLILLQGAQMGAWGLSPPARAPHFSQVVWYGILGFNVLLDTV